MSAKAKILPGAPRTDRVRLTLSRHDAAVLHAVYRFVGGPPEGPRGAFDGIGEALESVGIDSRSSGISVGGSVILR